LAFSRIPADFVVLEVGLGGRLDTTNVVEHPAVTAITPVSLDHQAFLGLTVTAIAAEKAGILKPGAPAVIGPQIDEAEAVIEARGPSVGAPLYRWGREWRCAAGGLARYEGSTAAGFTALNLPGAALDRQCRRQRSPTSTLAAARITAAPSPTGCAMSLRGAALRRGRLRLRMSVLELWREGGDNHAAGEVLGVVTSGWRDRPLHLVVGMLNTKDSAGFLAPMAPYARSLQAVTIPGEENPLPAATIAATARSVGIPAETADSVEAALRSIATAHKDGRLLVCGSLHFAGVVLRAKY
jgi:dihydrofolate synthase/folylpolyglutamate synthase